MDEQTLDAPTVPAVAVFFAEPADHDEFTTLPPSARPGRMTPRWWLMFAGNTTLWGVAYYVLVSLPLRRYAPIDPRLGTSALIWVVVALFATAFVVSSLVTGAAWRRFGQNRAAYKVGWGPSRLGAVAAAAVWIATNAAHVAPYWALVLLAWTLLEAIALRRALVNARARQAQILRVRQCGRVTEGVLTHREFLDRWDCNQAYFRVTVGFTDASGAATTQEVTMLAGPAQVPVLGTALRVVTDDRGSIVVELADRDTVEFEQRYRLWERPEIGAPRFTVDDDYSTITTLTSGARPGRMTPRWWIAFVVTTAAWALVWHAMCAALTTPGPSPTFAGLPLFAVLGTMVIAACVLSACVHTAARGVVGQTRAASKMGWAPARLGLMAAALVWMATTPQPLVKTLALIPIAWTLLEVIVIHRALAHARSRQEDIFRLRQSGRVAEGVLVRRKFRNAWAGNTACFYITVRYPDTTGETTTLWVKMYAAPARVPVRGTAMRVITDDRDTTIVELADPDGVEFEKKYKQWEQPED